MITTAALAWRQLRRDDFRRHVVVLQQPVGWDSLPTFLVKMSPWTRAELGELSRLAALSDSPQVVVENPLEPEASFLSDEFYSGTLSSALQAAVPYAISPATDDRPYFNFLRETPTPPPAAPESFVTAATAQILDARTRKFIPMDLIHLIVTAAVSLTFAVVFLLLPLRFSAVGRAHWPGKNVSLLYFASLGAGFIIIELVFIQIFMKLIGFPLYTVSGVILTMLVAAGIGSAASEKLGIGVRQRWSWPFVAIGVIGLALAFAYPALFEVFLAWPIAARLAVAGALIFPLGFFLGMPFPLGILSLESMPRGAIAWAWALNGLFTLIGGLASVLLSIYVGFQVTLILGLGIYAIAWGTFSRMRTAAA